MNPWFLVPFLGLLALLQATLGSTLAPFNIRPNLMLVAVVSWSLYRGAREGMLWAFVGGLWLDLFASGPFGLSPLTLMLISLTAALGQVAVFRTYMLLPITAVALGSLVHGLVYLLLMGLFGYVVSWFDHVWRIVLPTLPVNLLLAAGVYPLVGQLHRLTGREEISW